jgi:predicted dithiol-disulfide oxidoreductase (DUF899 family)
VKRDTTDIRRATCLTTKWSHTSKWLKARLDLLAAGKDFMRQRDALTKASIKAASG